MHHYFQPIFIAISGYLTKIFLKTSAALYNILVILDEIMIMYTLNPVPDLYPLVVSFVHLAFAHLFLISLLISRVLAVIF